MKYRAFYTDYPWADIELERSILAEADCELTKAPEEDEATLSEYAKDCDAILTCWAKVTRAVVDATTHCKIIARTGIGLDNIDVERATEREIIVTNVPDYCIPEVVEHSLALMFALGRKIHLYHQSAQSGAYDRTVGLPLERMEDQTVGVVGLGRIGSLFAERCVGLGMTVLGNNRSKQVPAGVTWCEVEELLKQSDYVVLLCPLTDETHHLVNAESLALMKPTAMLVNTSRGGLIDHNALATALAKGKIAGAGLDVQDPEPPNMQQAPYNDPRVIVTPHAAFMSTAAVEELRRRVAHQVAAVLKGETPENIVNG